jgi:hypothetical protein
MQTRFNSTPVKNYLTDQQGPLTPGANGHKPAVSERAFPGLAPLSQKTMSPNNQAGAIGLRGAFPGDSTQVTPTGDRGSSSSQTSKQQTINNIKEAIKEFDKKINDPNLTTHAKKCAKELKRRAQAAIRQLEAS